jgi:hypothetical protein
MDCETRPKLPFGDIWGSLNASARSEAPTSKSITVSRAGYKVIFHPKFITSDRVFPMGSQFAWERSLEEKITCEAVCYVK